MSRPVKFPPAIHSHKSSGQDRVRWQGRDYYLGRTGSAESRAAYARLVAQLADGLAPKPKATASAITVNQVVAAWETEERPRYDQAGREPDAFRRSLLPLRIMFGPTPAADFDADALETLRAAMCDGSWNPDVNTVGWSRVTVNRRIVRVRTVWRWAERKKLVPAGAWGNLLSLRGLAPNDRRVRQSPKRKAYSWEDVRAVVRELPPTPRLMLLLQWWTGMRSGEVRILRPCDVDRTDADWVYRPSQHKNLWRGQSRIVLLGPKCRALLRRLIDAVPPDEYLFGTGPGRCYKDYTYAQVVSRAADRAGVVGFHPYCCRHAAKDRIKRAMGLDAARAVLGQKSISVTDGYGEQLDLRQATEAARKLS